MEEIEMQIANASIISAFSRLVSEQSWLKKRACVEHFDGFLPELGLAFGILKV